MSNIKFKFRRHSTVGAAAAEEDGKFLGQCFVDTGDIATLSNCKEPNRIVLGRTGVGKSALLIKLIEEKEAIVINPESLSFNYLTNSTILKFFLDAGIMDPYFRTIV
jgi:hypothetical protein